MGIGPAGRELYRLLDLKPPGRVCDLGSQEMSYVGDDGSITHRESARDWLEAQGFEYECIDIDGRHDAIVLDLNTAVDPTLEFDDLLEFDIVTNHGTSEHVFNQANVFKLMHDLTVVGGLMIHAVPTPNFGTGHGFYFYDETIFNDLAFANGYEIVQIFRRSEPHEIILVAMRKTIDAPFQMPIQGMYR
jgi:SAM-dependent methyltransferase